MTHVDAQQCASTCVAAVVASSYQVGNNHVFNFPFDDVNNDAEYH